MIKIKALSFDKAPNFIIFLIIFPVCKVGSNYQSLSCQHYYFDIFFARFLKCNKWFLRYLILLNLHKKVWYIIPTQFHGRHILCACVRRSIAHHIFCDDYIHRISIENCIVRLLSIVQKTTRAKDMMDGINKLFHS